MGTKNKPGKFDCYENAEPDEPMFILLARDPLASILVDLWAQMRALTRGDSPKVLEAIECASAMRWWKPTASPAPAGAGAPPASPKILAYACVNPQHTHHRRNDLGCQWQPVYEQTPDPPERGETRGEE
jgi:hypothetical protein